MSLIKNNATMNIQPSTAWLVIVVYTILLMVSGLGLYKYYSNPVGRESFSDYSITRAQQKVRADINNSNLRVDLGWAYFQKFQTTKKMGYLEQAQKEYLQALKIDSANVAAKYNLSLVSMEQNRQIEAIRLLNEVIQVNPRHSLAHFALGKVYSKKGQIDSAIKEYNQVISISPGSANVMVDLGSLYEKKGQAAEAIKNYELALKYDPKNKLAINGVKRLRE